MVVLPAPEGDDVGPRHPQRAAELPDEHAGLIDPQAVPGPAGSLAEQGAEDGAGDQADAGE